MACTPAPACVAVRKQATRLWPARSQASDGVCASSQHTTANPGSDHEPHVVIDGKAYATAVDLTDDKAHGCDADAWAEYLRLARDKRVKYVICNQRMFSSYPVRGIPPWTWRTYTGSNPHDKHTHLSVLPEFVFDTGPWFPQLVNIDPQQPGDILMRDERIIEVPAPDTAGRQHVAHDTSGAPLGTFATTSSVQVCASAEGRLTRLHVEPFAYLGALVLAVANPDGTPAQAGRKARVVIEHR